jgi:hypothetical protein
MKSSIVKQRAFVLLTAIGILAILGMVIFSLSLNVEFTYRFTRMRATQRDLAHVLEGTADALGQSPNLIAKLTKSPLTLPPSTLSPGRITVRATLLPQVRTEPALAPAGQVVALEALDESTREAMGRIGIYLIRKGAPPVVLTEFAEAKGTKK